MRTIGLLKNGKVANAAKKAERPKKGGATAKGKAEKPEAKTVKPPETPEAEDGEGQGPEGE